MKWYVPVGIAAVGLGAFLVVRSARASLAPKRVAVIGDSLVGGQSFMLALKASLASGSLLEVHSFPGQGTGHILDELGAVLFSNPEIVVVLAGVNDLASGRGPELVKTNLNEMYEAIREQGAVPVAVQLTPWRGHVSGSKYQAETMSVNGWIQTTAGVRDVRTDSLGDVNGTLISKYNNGDGLHLSADGQRALADLVSKRI